MFNPMNVINSIAQNSNMMDAINSSNTKKEYFDTLRSGDQARGEALANRILETYGLNKEEAIRQASQALPPMLSNLLGMK